MKVMTCPCWRFPVPADDLAMHACAAVAAAPAAPAGLADHAAPATACKFFRQYTDESLPTASGRETGAATCALDATIALESP